ncbi:MAG: hypothetical protein OXH05_03165, partial [Acidobacteria bacterium]|nr:hypothetical protein [Acidobacteriota bacterium]
PAASREFEEVQDGVRPPAPRQEAGPRAQALLDDLQRRHPVRIHTANLAFPYVGSLARVE